MSIGERIIELRKQCGISQGRLAALLEVSRQAVSKWENDASCPDTIKLIQLADTLNTDVEYLATGRHIEAVSDPIVIKSVEVQEKIVEKVVEKPVIKIVEKPVPQIVERTIEKPVLRRVTRVKYLRNPIELTILGALCFGAGLIIGHFLL